MEEVFIYLFLDFFYPFIDHLQTNTLPSSIGSSLW